MWRRPALAGTLILERLYVHGFGVLVRLRHLADEALHAAAALVASPRSASPRSASPRSAATVEPTLLAELCPSSAATDNFEGLAAIVSGDRLRILMVADNNFRASQHRCAVP